MPGDRQKGAIMALTLAQASRQARSLTWAETTRSVNILVSRNGRDREYTFDRRGMVIGRVLCGEVVKFDYPWMPK